MKAQEETPFLSVKTPQAYRELVGIIEKGYDLHNKLFKEYRNLDPNLSKTPFMDRCHKLTDKWVGETYISLLHIYKSSIYAEKFAISRGTLFDIQGLGLDFSGIVTRLENKLRVLHEYTDSIISLASPKINLNGNFIFQSGNLNKAEIKNG